MSKERDSERPTRETDAVKPRTAPSSSVPPPRYSLSPFAELKPVCELCGYFVVGRISKSATGETYLAYREETHGERRWYSLKLLSALVERQPELLAKVDQEISCSEAFDHPSIVSVTDTIAAATQRLVVLPWVRGVALSAPIWHTRAGQSALRWDLAVYAFREVCNVLREVIREDAGGLRVHGAIIPQNVVIDDRGRAHVLNLGLDVLRAGAQDLNIVYPFRAPEIRLSGKSTAAADVFGVGVCLLEMIAVGSARELLENPAATSEVVDRVCVQAKCPTTLSALIARAVAVEPSRRFVSLASLADALGRVPVVLEEEDLRSELVAFLRDQRELGFDRPPAMETADLRIADLAAKARLSEVSTDVEVQPPPEAVVDPTESHATDDALLDGVLSVSEGEPRGSRTGRAVFVVAAVLLAVAAVGVWFMFGRAEKTVTESVSTRVPSPQSSSEGVASPPAKPRSHKVEPSPGADENGADSTDDGGVDASVREPDADLEIEHEEGTSAEPAHSKRRRVAPKRRHQKKILANPGF